VALEVARRCRGDRRLGGVVSVSGSLLHETLAENEQSADAPPSTVLLTHGSRDSVRVRRRLHDCHDATKLTLALRGGFCTEAPVE
jgi:hypothetical protein